MRAPTHHPYGAGFLVGLLTTGVGQGVAIVAGVIGLALAARHMVPDQFGVYVLLEVVVSLFVVFSDLGTGLSTTRFLAAAESDSVRQQAIDTAVLSRLVLCLVVGMLALFSGPLVFLLFASKTLAELAVYIAVLSALTSFDTMLSYVLRGCQRFRDIAMAQVIASASRLALIVVLVVVFGLGVLGMVWAAVASLVASVLWQALAIPGRRSWSISGPVLKRLLTFGLPLGMNSLLTFGFQKTDAMIIGALLNPAQVAYYGLASKIPDSILRFFQSFETVYLPKVSESHAAGQASLTAGLLNNSLRLISFASALAGLVVVLFQREIVTVFFGSRYVQSAPILALLMVAVTVELILYVLGNTLVAIGHPEQPFKCNIATTVVSVAGTVLLVPLFGPIGAAYAKIASRCVALPLNTWFLRRGGYEAGSSGYLFPIAVLGTSWLVFLNQQAASLAVRLLVLAAYLSSSLLCRVISIRDLAVFLKTIGAGRVLRGRVAR